jgi:mycothiol synthase
MINIGTVLEKEMKPTFRACETMDDFGRARNFLREVFLLNDRLEHSWHVARLDYWYWHYIKTCKILEAAGKGMTLWENADGKIIDVLNHPGGGELRLHVDPHFRSAELENEMLAVGEEYFHAVTDDGRRFVHLPIFEDDAQRQGIAQGRGYGRRPNWGHYYRRDLESPIPQAPISSAYIIRSMGGTEEYPARSLALWHAFHNDEPDESYDGDHSWYANLQSAPLYRRDLDVVAVTSDGSIAAFCTIFYDEPTHSAVTVMVGTAFEHWRRGLGKAVLTEGLVRLKNMGCTRVFSTAHEEPADGLYRSVLVEMNVTHSWVRELS